MNFFRTLPVRVSLLAPMALLVSSPAWSATAGAPVQNPGVPPKEAPVVKPKPQKEVPVVKDVPVVKEKGGSGEKLVPSSGGGLRKDDAAEDAVRKKRAEMEEEMKRKEEILRRQKESGDRIPKGEAPVVKPVTVNGGEGSGIKPGLGEPTAAEKEAMVRREQEMLMQSDPGAKLVMEFGSERFDMGNLMQGDKVQHSFTMQAGGTTPLKIRQVKPSCGCTVGSVEVADAEGNFSAYNYGDAIDPGRNIRVNASMDTTNKKNKVQVRIQIMSNDPAGVHALTLAAEVQPFLVVSPQMVNFGDLPMGGARSQTVDIRTSKGEPVKMEIDAARLATVPAGMAYELVPVNPNAEGKSGHWQMKVNVNGEAQEGQMNAAFRLVTDVPMPVDAEKEVAAIERGSHIVPQYFSTNVSVAGNILGSFSIDRPYLSYGLFRPGQVVPRAVRLTCNEEALSLDNVTAKLQGRDGTPFDFADYFEISMKPVAGIKALDIELRMKGFPDGTDKSFNGEMVIDMGIPDCPQKLVKFTGICRSGVEQR